MIFWIVLGVIVAAIAARNVYHASHRVVRTGSKGLLFRNGALVDIRDAGSYWFNPVNSYMRVVSLALRKKELRYKRVVTTDFVMVDLFGSYHYRVVDPAKALVGTLKFKKSLRQRALTLVQQIGGEQALADLLHDTRTVAAKIEREFTVFAQTIGVEIDTFDLEVSFPNSIERAMLTRGKSVVESSDPQDLVGGAAPEPEAPAVQDGDIELATDPARDLRTPTAEPAPLPDAVLNG